MERFPAWILEELNKRGWKPADLSRETGISSGALSNILNDYRKPGPDVCRSIAHALRIPEETVFRQAGLLSPKPENAMADLLKGLVDLLNDKQLEYVTEIVEWRLSLQEAEANHIGRMEDEEKEKARLLKIVEQMSPEQRENEIKNLRSRARLLKQKDQEQKRTQ